MSSWSNIFNVFFLNIFFRLPNKKDVCVWGEGGKNNIQKSYKTDHLIAQMRFSLFFMGQKHESDSAKDIQINYEMLNPDSGDLCS